jgi:signal-transduction protein with cAMP-binding, CBS, and nucleotidyltransferase domain
MAVGFERIVRTRVFVREIMNSPVITAHPEEDVRTVAEKMSRARVGSVVIVDQDLPLGIVTDGDIVSKVVSTNSMPSEKKVREIMTAPLRMIESEKEIIEAAREMRSARIKRLGVSYKRKLVGMISMSDILSVTPELFEIISEKTRIVTSPDMKQPSYLAGFCDQCNQWSDGLFEIDDRFLCEECRSGLSPVRASEQDGLPDGEEVS